MDEQYERFLNAFIVLLDYFPRTKRGNWFLSGQTLVDFITLKRIPAKAEVGLINCKPEDFIERSNAYYPKRTKINDHKYVIEMFGHVLKVRLNPDVDKRLIIAPEDIIEPVRRKDTTLSKDGTWRYLLNPMEKYALPIPYRAGEYLDTTRPLWFKDIKHKEQKYNKNLDFFTPKRRENAVELMRLLQECATTAGFPRYIFPGFGTLLGIIREGGFISTDRDLDHCIQGDKITARQEERFLQEISKVREIPDEFDNMIVYTKGLYQGRKRSPQRRGDDDRFLWTSCGHKRIKGPSEGVKSCIWKFFNWDGYAWHSKGRKWISRKKFNMQKFSYSPEDEAIAKGLPAKYMDKFTQIKFHGLDINVPEMTGSCLDEWYPGWARPKKGASAKKNVLIIPSWEDKNTWRYA